MRFSVLFVVMLLSFASAKEARRGPLVSTANGPVRGVLRGFEEKSASWWGIPFAEPPVGNLRFRSPQPLQRTWTEPFDAEKAGSPCLQILGLPVLGQEDCLYLNVHAPTKPRTTGALPVMIWIYGGAYTMGDGFEFGLYDGKNLAEYHDVVVVTMNYRLSGLGFFALDALKQEDPHLSTGNYALHDQQLAMRWVQTNIANFGGDPGRVTLFGQSAGAFSVMWHLVSIQSKGLFHAAIMESGNTALSWFFQPYEKATSMYEDIARAMGCPASPEQLGCLRALPAMKFVDQAVQSGNASKKEMFRPAVHTPLWPLLPNGPVIDGSEFGLLDVPLSLVHAGRFNKVPLILGANANDGTIFEPQLGLVVPGVSWPVSLKPQEVKQVFAFFFENNVSQVDKVYKLQEYATAPWKEDAMLSRMMRDLIFLCPSRALAMAFAEQGMPTFLYVFDYQFGFLADEIVRISDFHAGETFFVWRNFLEAVKVLAPDQTPFDMANTMSCKWASFAYTHDPNGGDDRSRWPPNCEKVNAAMSAWPRFDLQQRFFYLLNDHPEIRQVRADNRYPEDLFPRDEKCDLWDKLSIHAPWHESSPTEAEVFV